MHLIVQMNTSTVFVYFWALTVQHYLMYCLQYVEHAAHHSPQSSVIIINSAYILGAMHMHTAVSILNYIAGKL